MTGIAFGSSVLLPLASVAVLVCAVYLWIAYRRGRAERAYGGAFAVRLRARTFSAGRRRLKAVLVIGAAALIGLAAARPQIGSHRTLLQREGTDVIIAFDVSLSMSAIDIAPSRLERAKGAVSALLDHVGGDRIGLVTFAGSAQLRFPLTTDGEAARKVVQSLGFKDGGLGAGTSIAAALRQTTDGFANDQTRSKIVVLVSDGEDLGDDAAGAASFVRSEGIGLYTIGVGMDTPVPIKVIDIRSGQQQNRIDPATGQPVLTTANPQALQQLASENRGRYYNGNSDDFAVQLSDEIGRLQKTRFDSGQGDAPIERFQYLLGLAIALLLIEYLLPAGKRLLSTRRARWRLPVAAAGSSSVAHSRAVGD